MIYVKINKLKAQKIPTPELKPRIQAPIPFIGLALQTPAFRDGGQAIDLDTIIRALNL